MVGDMDDQRRRVRAQWYGKSDDELLAAVEEAAKERDAWQAKIDQLTEQNETETFQYAGAWTGYDKALKRLGLLLVEFDRRQSAQKFWSIG